MYKIATHDSATGEKSSSFWRIPLIMFAMTQSKTLKEQYDAGCRLFDIRIKKYKDGWHCAHGIWKTKKTVDDILSELNMPYNSKEEQVKVVLTYEGKCKDEERDEMYAMILEQVGKWKEAYTNISFGPTSFKYGKNSGVFKVDYDYLDTGEKGWIECGNISKFAKLDFKFRKESWPSFTLIIIPYVWKKLLYDNPKFSEDYYTYVDFL